MKIINACRTILVGVATGSLALYCVATLPALQETSFDDAYMFLRYAKHWLSVAADFYPQECLIVPAQQRGLRPLRAIVALVLVVILTSPLAEKAKATYGASG